MDLYSIFVSDQHDNSDTIKVQKDNLLLLCNLADVYIKNIDMNITENMTDILQLYSKLKKSNETHYLILKIDSIIKSNTNFLNLAVEYYFNIKNYDVAETYLLLLKGKNLDNSPISFYFYKYYRELHDYKKMSKFIPKGYYECDVESMYQFGNYYAKGKNKKLAKQYYDFGRKLGHFKSVLQYFKLYKINNYSDSDFEELFKFVKNSKDKIDKQIWIRLCKRKILKFYPIKQELDILINANAKNNGAILEFLGDDLIETICEWNEPEYKSWSYSPRYNDCTTKYIKYYDIDKTIEYYKQALDLGYKNVANKLAKYYLEQKRY